MDKVRVCKDCGRAFPETRDFFGQYKNVRNGIVAIGFRNSCRECMAANTAKHSAAKPEVKQENIKRYWARAAQSGGSYSDLDIAAIRRALGDCCRFCGEGLNNKGHIDHLTPVSRGGSSNPPNVTLTCDRCNLAKTNKTRDEFIAWRKERSLYVRDMKLALENPDPPHGRAGRSSK